jgi:hypothetical protein
LSKIKWPVGKAGQNFCWLVTTGINLHQKFTKRLLYHGDYRVKQEAYSTEESSIFKRPASGEYFLGGSSKVSV